MFQLNIVYARKVIDIDIINNLIPTLRRGCFFMPNPDLQCLNTRFFIRHDGTAKDLIRSDESRPILYLKSLFHINFTLEKFCTKTKH